MTPKVLFVVLSIIGLALSVRFINSHDVHSEWTPRRRMHTNASRKLNILTFGGSTTWGASIPSRNDAYPSLLARSPLVDRSDNLAIRASSALWPATCLQSIVSEAGTQDLDYDVVILEFSITGLTGINLLLERLRRRYPDATIIYLDLYSNRRPGWSNCVSEKCRMTPAKQQALHELVSSVGGHFLEMPRPKDPMNFRADVVNSWFADDDHHLSTSGHEWVSQQVLSLLTEQVAHEPQPKSTRGDWTGGDVCANWFWTGTVPSSLQLSGGTMVEFSQDKHAYEINVSAKIQLTSNLHYEAPLIAVFMTKGDPSVYPMVQVTMDSQQESPIVINPLNRRWSNEHVTSTQTVGIVTKETHVVDIKVIESKPDSFRLVGLVMCGACKALDYDLTRACRHRGCVHTLDD